MEALRFVVLSAVLACAWSYPNTVSSQPQVTSSLANPQGTPSHQPHNIDNSVIQAPLSTDEGVTNHYPYQATGLAPTSNYHQPGYTSGSQYGNRDLYNREGSNSGWSYPYFGISAGMDYLFSAYIGPVCWAAFALVMTFVFCMGVKSLVSGGDLFGGLFQRSKDAVAGARSLDLDNLTNMVYQALDTYERYAAKAVRDQEPIDVKG